jgi:hypothetical protein
MSLLEILESHIILTQLIIKHDWLNRHMELHTPSQGLLMSLEYHIHYDLQLSSSLIRRDPVVIILCP